MERNRQLYYREGSSFQRVPEDWQVLTPQEISVISQTQETKVAVEGVSSFSQRHIMFGDDQIPDVDMSALNAVLKVNDRWRATDAWIMGDMINATTVGKFGFPANYERDLNSEILEGRGILKLKAQRLREANPDVKIRYLEGNHELRLQKYMDKHARELAMLTETDGQQTVSIPRLLGLNELGIEWIPYWEDEHIQEAVILHGNIARVKGGYTAQAYIDRYGSTTIAGHTHRLAMVGRTQNGVPKWGIETGSLCRPKMEVQYVREGQADWQQGFATLGIDGNGTAYPAIHPILKGKAHFADEIFDGRI